MDEPLATKVGLSASFITGSINSYYTISELWNSLSCEHRSSEWLLHPCQKCEDCHCQKCKDLHKRVSISEDDDRPAEPKHLGELIPTKIRSFNVRLREDHRDAWITGITIVNENKFLVADFENHNVKMFSYTTSSHKFLFSLCLRFRPWDIVVLSDDTVAVSMSGRQIALIKYGETGLILSNIIKLRFDVYGMAVYDGKLIVTSLSNGEISLPSVKLVDIDGKVYWSVHSSHKAKQHFKLPMYVNVYNLASSQTVIVTDSGNSVVTLLEAETGGFIKQIWLPWSKEPQCITTDDQNNVYMSYIGTNELAVMNEDLSESQILLSKRGVIGKWFYEGKQLMELGGRPWAIAFDKTNQQLVVSYENNNCIDFYKLTRLYANEEKHAPNTPNNNARIASDKDS